MERKGYKREPSSRAIEWNKDLFQDEIIKDPKVTENSKFKNLKEKVKESNFLPKYLVSDIRITMN